MTTEIMDGSTTYQQIGQCISDAANIIRKKGWTQRTRARDADGKSVYACSDEAKTFCPIGAVERASHIKHSNEDTAEDLYELTLGYLAARIAKRTEKLSSPHWVYLWNDERDRTKDEVLFVLDKAAEQAFTDQGVLSYL